MRHLTLDNITQAAADSFTGLPDARRRELVQAFVRHLHGYAREVRLTHAEWRAALGFLHRVGDISTPERSEFSLLSDVTGLSSLVDLLAADPQQPQATPGSNLGPFHAAGSPWRDNPVDLTAGNAGARVLLRARVLDTQGRPLARAEVDFWQNAGNGLYWQQDPSQPTDNLRCRLRTDDDGGFEIATIRPVPYEIPTDGPAYLELVQPAGRGSWRPAHFHLIVSRPGYRTLVTEVFDETDPYLERDAVFGVRDALVGRYLDEHDPAAAQRLGLAGPAVQVMRMDFALCEDPAA
jgi:protocatechuate 3,4-dioxygenase beta subunit